MTSLTRTLPTPALFLLIILLFALHCSLSGQKANRISHPEPIPYIVLDKPDTESALSADQAAEGIGIPLRVGLGSPADIDLFRDGQTFIRPDGSIYIRLGITLPDAPGLALYFDDFYLDEGSQLIIRDPRHRVLGGPYTHEKNPVGSSYYSSGILGNDTVILHFTASGTQHRSRVHIYEAAYMYRDFFGKSEQVSLNSGSCQVNVICSPEGDNWQDEKRGVARILLKVGPSYYLCSGSLVNNTLQDCTPYFLSADHCGSNATANDLNQWVFYFNYDGLNCSSTGPQTTAHQIVGASKKANASNSIGNTSDMVLLELNQALPESYQAYYNGWNRLNAASTSGTGIHHPAGDIKKISTYSSALTNYFNTHWEVVWISTTNGHGTTEGGSSGSPIFNPQGLIVGTLTGGYSGCSNLNAADYYGKFSYHWDQNGANNNRRLQPWLDPINTQAFTLPGKYCSYMNAAFSASATSVMMGDTIVFTDASSGNPSQWSWSFPGGLPDTSNLQHPSVVYPQSGVYDVVLTVSNSSNTDTETKTAYIIVADNQLTVCDTLRWPLSGTPVLYYDALEGYPCGTNVYGDLAKAEFFPNTDTSNELSGALLWFGAAAGSGSFHLAVWDNSGTNGTPGATPLATTQVNIASVINDVAQNRLTYIPFNPPVKPGHSFYLGVLLPSQSGDTIALVSNLSGQANPVNAWEQWSDGSWWHFNDAWVGTLDVQQAIFPLMCNSDFDSVYAGFMADTMQIPRGFAVTFSDTSRGMIQSRQWHFPGGQPSASQDSVVQVVYDSSGVFDVSLVVDGYLNSDTASKWAYINVYTPPIAGIHFDTNYTNVGGQLLFASASSGDDLSLSWTIPGAIPSSSSDSSIQLQFPDAGVYTIQLIVSSPWGEADTALLQIEVGEQVWGRLWYGNADVKYVSGIPVVFTDTIGNSDTILTNTGGYFYFSGLGNTPGSLHALPTLPIPSGAVNATDALLILQHFVGFMNIQGIQLEAADVDATGYVNSTDALLTARRFAGLITSFAAGDWQKEVKQIQAGSAAQRIDLRINMTGDVNASWTPAN
jgi:PKD repeat protein